ncbi:MAG: dephospho-CoA kinase [Bryobacteraceae bacterium]|nr:dephospho-CoA kinase [Bryobacteraceae bacterium]
MLRVGLTGGLACGKSFVLHALADLGCRVIRADDLGHTVLAPGGEAYDAVMAEFGTTDRGALAAEVFQNPERLAVLNSLVHPAVFRRQDAFAAAAEAEDPHAIVVVEAAILIETGSYKRYDRLIVVVCSHEQQIARAMHRGGVTLAQVESRLRSQMPLDEKRKYADYIIDSSGAKEQTLEQTRRVFEDLRSLTR